ncbi:hypothetical protein Mth01_01760 [Sphaerimonospora thailandensis]|uniref:Uncharacterized protein n=1 Tax=Sphaerimonospora thailandensis TaxID=795644 RepID=A0A8J3VXH7_9ACTN|nr:hypothetical protein Mth01_01760 [Sphaerimonospora thailandensis]
MRLVRATALVKGQAQTVRQRLATGGGQVHLLLTHVRAVQGGQHELTGAASLQFWRTFLPAHRAILSECWEELTKVADLL